MKINALSLTNDFFSYLSTLSFMDIRIGNSIGKYIHLFRISFMELSPLIYNDEKEKKCMYTIAIYYTFLCHKKEITYLIFRMA